MSESFYKFVDVPSFTKGEGSLTMYESHANEEKKIPFSIKRVLVIQGMKLEDQRGGHTHHKTHQILFCVAGSCTVSLDNGKQKKTVKLTKSSRGIYLFPYVWHTMQDFSADAVLLVLANTPYREKDYIRNYDEFLSLV